MSVEKKTVTLGDIITLFDEFYNIRIWVDYDYDETEIPDWEGLVEDIPWIYLDYVVNNNDNQKIRIGQKDGKELFFVINLRAPEKE